MPKVKYNEIELDSELELDFYKYLEEKQVNFVYQNAYKFHPIRINLGRRKNYTPDFIVCDDENKDIWIIETKGYAKWSANEDNNIMDFMRNKVQFDTEYLIDWLKEINLYKNGYQVKYERIKHLKSIGFVPYDFKNPNSIANKRKQKIEELEKELKELKKYKKDCERFFNYCWKMSLGGQKLTKQQLAWFNTFYCFNIATKDGKAKPIHLNLENIDKYMKENNHED